MTYTDLSNTKIFRVLKTVSCFALLAASIAFCFSLLKYSFYPIDEPYPDNELYGLQK